MGPIRRESRGKASGGGGVRVNINVNTTSAAAASASFNEPSIVMDPMEIEKENSNHEIDFTYLLTAKDIPSSSSGSGGGSSSARKGRKSLSSSTPVATTSATPTSASTVAAAAVASPVPITASTIASSSSVKKSQQRRIHKYASKYLEAMLEDMVEDAIKKAKHPMATKKWLSKLRASILKKVSQSSQRLYLTPENDLQELDRRINATQEEIRAKTQQLQELALAQIQRSRLSALPPLPELRSNAFIIEEKVKVIGEKIGLISQEVSTTTKNMEERVNSFGQTLVVVRSNIDAVLERASALKLLPLGESTTTTSTTGTTSSSSTTAASSSTHMVSIASTTTSTTTSGSAHDLYDQQQQSQQQQQQQQHPASSDAFSYHSSSHSSTNSLDGNTNTHSSVVYQVPQPSYTTAGGNRVMATPREPMQRLYDHLGQK